MDTKCLEKLIVDLISAPGPSGIGKFEYYRDLRDSVKGKQDAGFATTIADFWGLSLSYQLISPDKGGPGTFSHPS